MKVYLDSIGCRLNQAEIEIYARQLRAAGHTLVSCPDHAELAIINTCTVTAAADADSRQKIRQSYRAGVKEIVLTGCWSSLHPDEAITLSGVSRIFPNSGKDRLVPDILQVDEESLHLETIARHPIPGLRRRTRAFIKVQDGCDNHCAYCITTIARGPARSRALAEILADIHAANPGDENSNCFTKEIVLTGVHLGSWGTDFSPPSNLRQLVQTILQETNVPRLRLSSLEPWDLDGDFFSLWEDPRLCRQIHMPLQSGCAATLQRMARNTTPEAYSQLVKAARAACPDIAITTDIITGFPGESNSEFHESLQFVKAMQFASGHVFTYSERPGTAAARMDNQIPLHIRKERNAQMRSLLKRSAHEYRIKYLDQVLTVLWESAAAVNIASWQLCGLTDNYLRVYAISTQDLRNIITPVHILGMNDAGLVGEIVDVPPMVSHSRSPT